MLSKNVNNKKYAPKLVFFNEKKIEKDSYDFWHRKIDFASQILALFDTFPLVQFSKYNNFLWVCWFLGKNLSNFVPSAWKLNNPYYHNIQNRFFFFPFFASWSSYNYLSIFLASKNSYVISTTYCSFFC